MKLRYSPASPFVRKVRISAALLGLDRQISLELADTTDPTDSVRQQNPLGKIPVLVLDDGTALYDSLVIVTYLDSLSDSHTLIPDGAARWRVLTTHSLADGICEAVLTHVYEKRFRPEDKRHQPWLDHQADKIDRALATLEAGPPPLAPTIDLGAVAIASALGYLDLRLDGRWRAGHPNLVAWLDGFSEAVPAFAETAPPDQ